MQYDKYYPGVTEALNCLCLLPYQIDLLEKNPCGARFFFDFETKYRGPVLVVKQEKDSCSAAYIVKLEGITKEGGKFLWVLRYPQRVIDVPVIMENDWEENHFEKGYISVYPANAGRFMRKQK